MPPRIITLLAQTTEIRAEVRINGIPVLYFDWERTHQAFPCNDMVRRGANRLTVIINPGQKPSLALDETSAMALLRKKLGQPPDSREKIEQDAMSCRVQVIQTERGATVDFAEKPLTQIEWIGEEKPAARFPHVIESEFKSDAAQGPWLWETAPRLTLGPETRADAEAILSKVWKGLDQRRMGELAKLWEARLLETTEAYGVDPAEKTAAFARSFEEHVRGIKDWSMTPLDRERFDLRLTTDDRMIECIADDWKPILRGGGPNPEDDASFFGLLLCRGRGGELVVIR